MKYQAIVALLVAVIAWPHFRRKSPVSLALSTATPSKLVKRKSVYPGSTHRKLIRFVSIPRASGGLAGSKRATSWSSIQIVKHGGVRRPGPTDTAGDVTIAAVTTLIGARRAGELTGIPVSTSASADRTQRVKGAALTREPFLGFLCELEPIGGEPKPRLLSSGLVRLGWGIPLRQRGSERYLARTSRPDRALPHLTQLAYLGSCRLGDVSHSLMWEAVSAWRALRMSWSRLKPGGVPRASFRSRFASSARRCSRDVVCLKRRRVFISILSAPQTHELDGNTLSILTHDSHALHLPTLTAPRIRPALGVLPTNRT